MCGIAGVLYPEPKLNNDDFLSLMRSMGDTLKHRGPDDHQTLQINNNLFYGFHRLAINDSSPY